MLVLLAALSVFLGFLKIDALFELRLIVDLSAQSEVGSDLHNAVMETQNWTCRLLYRQKCVSPRVAWHRLVGMCACLPFGLW